MLLCKFRPHPAGVYLCISNVTPRAHTQHTQTRAHTQHTRDHRLLHPLRPHRCIPRKANKLQQVTLARKSYRRHTHTRTHTYTHSHHLLTHDRNYPFFVGCTECPLCCHFRSRLSCTLWGSVATMISSSWTPCGWFVCVAAVHGPSVHRRHRRRPPPPRLPSHHSWGHFPTSVECFRMFPTCFHVRGCRWVLRMVHSGTPTPATDRTRCAPNSRS